MEFADYFLSVGLPLRTVHHLDGNEVIGGHLASLCPGAVSIDFDEQGLIDAFLG